MSKEKALSRVVSKLIIPRKEKALSRVVSKLIIRNPEKRESLCKILSNFRIKLSLIWIDWIRKLGSRFVCLNWKYCMIECRKEKDLMLWNKKRESFKHNGVKIAYTGLKWWRGIFPHLAHSFLTLPIVRDLCIFPTISGIEISRIETCHFN